MLEVIIDSVLRKFEGTPVKCVMYPYNYLIYVKMCSKTYIISKVNILDVNETSIQQVDIILPTRIEHNIVQCTQCTIP